jgi:hypothetical protein
MSALAADYFLADLTIPPQSSIPADGELLYDAIYSRQVDSLGRGFTVATKILRWMAAPDTGPTGLRARTASEHARVTARLARGELVQLALVLGRADGRTKLWENHQVLAYALTDDTPIAAIRIYDPNYPKDDSARLVFEPSPAADALSCVRLTANDRRSVRGVFAIEYEHKRPGSGSIHLENAGLK